MKRKVTVLRPNVIVIKFDQLIKCSAPLTSRQESKCALTGLLLWLFYSVNCHVRTSELKPVRILTGTHTFVLNLDQNI